MISKCEWCGKPFDRKNAQRYCCEQCKKAAAGKGKRSKQKNSVTDIAVAARAAGMTYGEYVARVLSSDRYSVKRKPINKNTEEKHE